MAIGYCLFLNGCFCSCLEPSSSLTAHTAAFALGCSGGFFIFRQRHLSAFSALRSARPSAIAAQTVSRINSIDFDASSFAGITKSMSVGSEFVSTIPNTGMPRRFASATAMCSLRTSTTKGLRADG